MAARRIRVARNHLLGILAVLMTLAVEPARGETLLEAMQAAQGTNPRLNAERARQRAEAEKVPQARAGFLPTVSATLDSGRSQTANNLTGLRSPLGPRGAGLTISQPIFNGLRNVNDYAKAQAEVEAGLSQLISVEHQILLQAVQAYVRVVRDRRILGLRIENLGNLRAELAQANSRFRAGDLSRTGVDQTLTRVAESEADLAQAEADLAEAEATYRAVIGRAAGALRSPRLGRLALPSTLAEAVAIAEQENPLIRSALLSGQAAERGVASAQGALAPTVSLEGTVRRGIDDTRTVGTDVTDTTVRVRVAVPIFSGGVEYSKLREARETQIQRQNELADARVTARRAVAAAFEGERGIRLRQAASLRRVAAAEAAVRGLMIEYRGGNLPLVQVLDGRRELVNAKIAAVIADHDRVVASFTLLAGMGRIGLDSLRGVEPGEPVAITTSVAAAQARAGRALGDIDRRVNAHSAQLAMPSPSSDLASMGSAPLPPEAPRDRQPLAAADQASSRAVPLPQPRLAPFDETPLLSAPLPPSNPRSRAVATPEPAPTLTPAPRPSRTLAPDVLANAPADAATMVVTRAKTTSTVTPLQGTRLADTQTMNGPPALDHWAAIRLPREPLERNAVAWVSAR